ncbi:hypothetical protein NQZ79_g4556 [Umbelopsis isabellina]|nr:hypothetical protein NQZ79_g4556 [Umbelopsis isabellina]
MAIEKSPRVLSIQSHVVSGYAGNKAATFPLQTLGYDVDVMNILQFSNHTGYSSWGGQRVPSDDIKQIFEGLEKNGLTKEYTHILTGVSLLSVGYIGNAATLQVCREAIEKIKSTNSVTFVCDPVMGDDGKLYVSPEVLPLYREMIRMADIITPNQTEAEALVDMKIGTLNDAQEVIEGLHKLGAKHVIITSVHLPREDIPSQLINDTDLDKIMVCMGSSRSSSGSGDSENVYKQFLISFPSYRGYFTGTGDMLSALMVARLTEQEQAANAKSDDELSLLAKATFKSMLTLNAVTEKTWKRQKEYVKLQGGADIEGKPETAQAVHHCELMVVQGKQAIENPDSFNHGQIKIVAI